MKQLECYAKDLNKLNNFGEIYKITSKLDKKEKGDLFELFTFNLFKLDPRLNINLDKIWLYADIPKSILERLGLPSKDKGIDLLAKINSKYYAIQCKFRQDPGVIVPWSSLGNFFGLSFGMNDKIAGGFLITNTYDLCNEVMRSNKVVSIYSDYFDNLPKQFFRSIGNDTVLYVKKTPFIHQMECKNAVCDHLDTERRGYVEMACGSGKSLTAYWIMKQQCKWLGIIFVPSLQLLSQFATDFINQAYAEKEIIDYLMIGSDSDIDSDTKYKSNGLILTTDLTYIKKYIIECDKKLIVFCTYQSANKLTESIDKEFAFEIAIFDEAHKTVGQIDKEFGHMLTNKHMRIKKRLFVTATPKFYNGVDDNIVGMNNEKIYGKCIYTYNTGQAIEDKMLTDYQVLLVTATNKSIVKDIKKNKLVKYEEEFDDMEANYLGTILILLKKMHDQTINHLITYHGTVARAKLFAKLLGTINKLIYNDDDINISSIEGSDSMNTRKNIIRDFNEADKAIICSSRVLNEGVNIPIIDSVCFADARESVTDIIQCAGRSMRLYDGKDLAYIIVPTFVDGFDDDFDKNAFRSVINVLKSLKITDPGIVEYLVLKMNGRKHGRRNLIVSEPYVNVSKEIDFDKWQDCISTNILKVIDGWSYKFDQVKEWIEENNRIPSKKSNNSTERSLGEWCASQRQYKKNDKLTNGQIKQLAILHNWYWDYNDAWNLNYSKLKEWVDINKKIPSQGSKKIEEKTLAFWCSTQRRNESLTDNQIELLNKIPGWNWGLDDVWLDTYLKVEKWIYSMNKLPSAMSKDPTEKIFGNWCKLQRKKMTQCELKKYRKQKLDKLPGWYWNLDDLWKNTYSKLKDWINLNNKIPSNGSKNSIEYLLGNWCSKQRQSKKKNKLSKYRENQLEKLPCWYWTHNS